MASFNNQPSGTNFIGQPGVQIQNPLAQPSAPTFSPQQNPMMWPQPQVQQGPRMIIDWIDGESGMQAYPLGIDTIAYLFDKSSPDRFFIKMTDRSGMPVAPRIFYYKEKVEEAKKEDQPITREEFDNLLKMVSDIKEAL